MLLRSLAPILSTPSFFFLSQGCPSRRRRPRPSNSQPRYTRCRRLSVRVPVVVAVTAHRQPPAPKITINTNETNIAARKVASFTCKKHSSSQDNRNDNNRVTQQPSACDQLRVRGIALALRARLARHPSPRMARPRPARPSGSTGSRTAMGRCAVWAPPGSWRSPLFGTSCRRD